MMTLFTRIVLIVAAIFFSYDLIVDFSGSEVEQSEGPFHLIMEPIVFVLVLIALVRDMMTNAKLRKTIAANEVDLSRLRSDLGETIRHQLEGWKLTDSETEVAWLIIKGFSFAEIGQIRSVKEKTVRQQATSIYSKSKTANRSEFTAGFIEDLLAEQQAKPSTADAETSTNTVY